MKDTIIKETGNSRFLRSGVAEDITFAEFIALLRAGQLPIDLAGINEEGIDILGMPLGKSTLLDDETETVIWGSPGDRKPTEALKTIFETLSAGVSEKAKIVTGTYTGDGAASRTISLGFTPKAVILRPKEYDQKVGNGGWGDSIYGTVIAVTGSGTTGENYNNIGWILLQIVAGGFEVQYQTYDTSNYTATANTNASNVAYNYIAIA